MELGDLIYDTHVDLGPNSQINFVLKEEKDASILEDWLRTDLIEPSKVSDFSHTITQNGRLIGALGLDLDIEKNQIILHLFFRNSDMEKNYAPIVAPILEQLKNNNQRYTAVLAPVHPGNITTIRTLFAVGFTRQKVTLPGNYIQFIYEIPRDSFDW